MSLVIPVDTAHSPESLAAALPRGAGLSLLRSTGFQHSHARFSLLAADPLLTFHAQGSVCRLTWRGGRTETHFGNPWHLLDALLARFELLDQPDLPFPLGGAFGFWGYDLGRHLEPRLRGGPPREFDRPDAWLGFHDRLVVFDHSKHRTYLVSTGLLPDGSRDRTVAQRQADDWLPLLQAPPAADPPPRCSALSPSSPRRFDVRSNLDRASFCHRVERARRYVRSGDIYQVNLAQRFLAAPVPDPWRLWLDLTAVSPAPFAAYIDAGDLQIASVSPELFLRLSGRHIVTRPIKGTRPRSADPITDAQWTFDLQTSAKEVAELVMITDLLRNDLGKVCEYGSVQVPDLMRLERFAQVQHLVSTVEGRLRPEISHLDALQACFPGGSITGAPKIRAAQIIDELEPVARGPYTGCAGYLGFNRESQLSILIRSSIVQQGVASYHAGAGIVADSHPDAEYEETLAKARAFLHLFQNTAGEAHPLPIPCRPR